MYPFSFKIEPNFDDNFSSLVRGALEHLVSTPRLLESKHFAYFG